MEVNVHGAGAQFLLSNLLKFLKTRPKFGGKCLMENVTGNKIAIVVLKTGFI